MPSAKVNIVDAIQFARTQEHDSFAITDEHNNYLHLTPQTKSVNGRFVQGENHLATLPQDYRHYSIVLENDAVVNAADIDAILTWGNALDIKIADNANVAYELSLRKGTNLQILNHLELTVQRHSYKKLNVRLLLKQFSITGSMVFKASPGMTTEEMQEFADNQRVLRYRTTVDSESFILTRG